MDCFDKEKRPPRARSKRLLEAACFAGTAVIILWIIITQTCCEGVLRARRLTRIRADSFAELKKLIHQKGDSVRQGALLARFESTELVKREAQNAARIEQLRKAVELQSEKIRLCEKETARKKILYENQVIGISGFEKTKQAEISARKAGLGIEEELRAAQEEAEYLKSKAEALAVKAPFSGVLLSDPAQYDGSWVKRGEVLFEIADPESYFLEVRIPENRLSRIRTGNAAKINFLEFPFTTYSGELVRITPEDPAKIKKGSRDKPVALCEIKLDGALKVLRHGMRARVRILS